MDISTPSMAGFLRTEPSPGWVASVSSANNPTRQAVNKKDTHNQQKMDMEQMKIIQKLKMRDTEVRQHENSHKAAGGPYAGSPTYTYQKGPDGRMYAVGGEVSIDTSPIPGKPKETVKKAEIVKRAALAPAQPSNEDLQVAAKASQMKMKAKMEQSYAQPEFSEPGFSFLV